MKVVSGAWLISASCAVLFVSSSLAVCRTETAMALNPTNAERLSQICDSASRALASVAQLRDLPAYWRRALGPVPDDGVVSQRFWLVVIVGLVAAAIIGSALQHLFDREVSRFALRPEPPLRRALRRAGVIALSLGAFAALFWLALVGVASGNRLLNEISDRVVWAALEWRIAIAILTIIFSPERGELRLLGIVDDDARRCMPWLAFYATVSPVNYTFLWLVERIGFPQAVLFGTTLALGLLMTGYKIAMLWAIRRPIARAILAATDSEPSRFRRAVAAGWHWFFVLLSLVIVVAATIALALGRGSSVYGAATLTQLILVVLAIAWQVGQKSIDHLAARTAAATPLGLRQRRFVHAARRICDTLLALLGIVWLGEVWGLDIVAPPHGSSEQIFLRPALLAVLTAVIAWIACVVVSGIIDERIPQPATPGDDEERAAERVSRLGTLLPLLRNLLVVAIGIVALVVALSSLGVNLAPLLAGLGVIGIALGFGAQNLVRDIISGVFFLMEDAFRVGDYIDTGRLRGTVEGMSLRSVRLRHQNGPVHTIPFGQVQAVTNHSRDWAVVKFNLHLDPAAEIELVRKTIKRVGQDLLEDPDIGGDFIGPLKMQGVTDVTQTALVVRCKFTARPGRPTYLQRQALHGLIAAFVEAEIR